MTNTEQGESQQRETRLCNVCLYLKDTAEFNGGDIGCKSCRNVRNRQMRYNRANDLLFVKEYGKHITGAQVEFLTALVNGHIFRLDVDCVEEYTGITRQRAVRWMRDGKFLAAVDCVITRYKLDIDVPELAITRKVPPKMPILKALEQTCPANIAVMTPEARLNAIVRMVVFLKCELVFKRGVRTETPIYCALVHSPGAGLAVFETQGKTLTEVLDSVADAIINKDLGIIPVDMLKIMLGELKIG